MTFDRPEALLLGPVLALLLSSALLRQWLRLSQLRGAYGPVASLRLVPRTLHRFPAGRMLCLVLASFALGAAVAAPRPDVPDPPAPVPPLDIAVVVDVSRSMSAEDVEPSRVGRARRIVNRLAETLPSARIVLILFADWPYTLVPPTDDPTVVRYFAHALSADLVLDRDQGTSLATAIAHAHHALTLRPRAEAAKAILVLSDGDAHDDASAAGRAAAEAYDAGIRTWTGGLGTSDGAPISTGGGPLLDRDGQVVVAALEAAPLRAAAADGGGRYHDVSDDQGLDALLRDLTGTRDESTPGEDAPVDPVFWLTLAALPLLLLESGLDLGRGRGIGAGRRVGGRE